MLFFEFYALKNTFYKNIFNAIAILQVVCCEVLTFVKIWLCVFVLRYNNLSIKFIAVFRFESVTCR